MEHCHNPWKEDCQSEDIKVYIQHNGENHPICKTCWLKIADSDKEWGSTPKPNLNVSIVTEEETDE